MISLALKNILVSDFPAAKKVVREFFFFLPDLENKIVSDFAVGEKVMRERFFGPFFGKFF